MKVDEILNETVSGGMTSVASIGSIVYSTHPNRIKLYKRGEGDCKTCVATIKRTTGKGWSLVTNENWHDQKLPHFGHLDNIKTTKNGMKTISSNLESMFKKWGIKYDELKMMEKTY